MCRQPRDCVDYPAGRGEVRRSAMDSSRRHTPDFALRLRSVRMPSLLVFGARNLGRTIAHHHAAKGWDVAAVARSEPTLERIASEVPGALTIRADAVTPADVERAFTAARERFGGIDLVVSAISPSLQGPIGGGDIAAGGPEALDPYLKVLLPALVNVVTIGSRALKEQGNGTLVLVTGGSARRGMAGRGPWATVAFASRGLIQAVASELREHGVHAALLIVDATIESEKTAERLAGKPDELSTTEEDVARAVDYLASQSPRGWTHELQLTPRGDRWVP